MTPAFQEHVSLKFQLYDSLFMTLPFGSTLKSGSYLPLLSLACVKGFSIRSKIVLNIKTVQGTTFLDVSCFSSYWQKTLASFFVFPCWLPFFQLLSLAYQFVERGGL